tara:strand:- start:1012 stop:1725 length:714 start_codon:yes stop_codon:yes gene_type:complete
MFPAYYIIHYNIFFGWFHKKFIKRFKYKNFIFELKNCDLPLPSYSSFIFNTYELNDRILLEKNLSKKNKCIIIGGGIGFVPSITNKITGNKIIVFEINKKIIPNLKKNLNNNCSNFKIYKGNLLLNKRDKFNFYYSNRNFLASSLYRKDGVKKKINNYWYKNLTDLSKFNTLIIDGEGVEKHYIENIKVLKNIRYLYFEFHNDIFTNIQKTNIFANLKKEKFYLRDKFINSYYFVKD